MIIIDLSQSLLTLAVAEATIVVVRGSDEYCDRAGWGLAGDQYRLQLLSAAAGLDFVVKRIIAASQMFIPLLAGIAPRMLT